MTTNMAESWIDFETLEINFVDDALPSDNTCQNQKQINRFYIGQLVNANVKLEVTQAGLNKLKNSNVSQQTKSPRMLNILSGVLRQLAASIDVRCNITGVKDTPDKEVNPQGAREWRECRVVSSWHESVDIQSKTSKVEPFLSEDNCFYYYPIQVRVPEISSQYERAELLVNVKPVSKHTPTWLSSPTRQETRAGEVDSADQMTSTRGKKVTVNVGIIHPPALLFQHRTVAGKQMLMVQVKNTTFYNIKLEDCVLLPEACPKSSGHQTCSSEKMGTKHSNLNKTVCVLHANMVKMVCGQREMFPVFLSVGECYSLCYSLNTASYTDNFNKDELSLEAHVRWNIPYSHGSHDSPLVLTTYSVPTLRIRQAYFIICADVCEGSVLKKGDSFTVSYSITNRLQDFLSVKLHWNPVLLDNTEMSRQNLERVQKGLLCQDPCVQLGEFGYGTTVQTKVRFTALTSGSFEVCRHMKINLRYLIPSADNTSVPSPTSQGSTLSEDHQMTIPEELWRSRSGSGSSFNDPRVANAEERRLSFANKSYSFGDLAPNKSADSSIISKEKSPERLCLRGGQRDQLLNLPAGQTYEQTLLEPSNFLKNSCVVCVK